MEEILHLTTQNSLSTEQPAFFGLLDVLYRDHEMRAIFSEERTIQSWLDAEIALAQAQADVGLLTAETAKAIARAAVIENIDRAGLWEETRNVGYPILPIVRMIAAAAPDGPNGQVHYGATTQDIMDTGLALQLSAALDLLESVLGAFGSHLAEKVHEHRGTVMAARTHAQQAVPTTLGAKFAVLLAEVTRHVERLRQLRPRLCVVSLFGAGGTSAALGPKAPEIRERVGTLLGLGVTHVPWHVSRDCLAEFGLFCATVSATCARLAREVIDLSRTEVGELKEADGHHRGASSTMPQKANPISCEAIVGVAVTAGSLASSLFRAMEAGHERAAGEWQVEWQVLPQLAESAATCVRLATEVLDGLRVFPEVMRENLTADGGLVMAEAYMMRLAPTLGREVAHDLVYAASQLVRRDSMSLAEAVVLVTPESVRVALNGQVAMAADEYLGCTDHVCDSAVAAWQATAALSTQAAAR